MIVHESWHSSTCSVHFDSAIANRQLGQRDPEASRLPVTSASSLSAPRKTVQGTQLVAEMATVPLPLITPDVSGSEKNVETYKRPRAPASKLLSPQVNS